jgi:uncharacterized protein
MDEGRDLGNPSGPGAAGQATDSLIPPDGIDRLAPARRPGTKPVGYQSWRDLVFLHWRVPAEELQPLLPDGLTVDTFQGDAWVGLVPFKMRKIRPWWSPPIPGISNFLETNVRTYVHCDGEHPGVWFFSLDASSRLAVRVARWKWNLNYFPALMHDARHQELLRYESHRPKRSPVWANSRVEVLLPETIQTSRLTSAEPDTREHFLLERYLLYAVDARNGMLWRGQVHHPPYRFCPVELVKARQTLLAASGIAVAPEPESVLYSPGVDVEVFPLHPISRDR